MSIRQILLRATIPMLVIALGSCMGKFSQQGVVKRSTSSSSIPVSGRSLDEIQADIDDLTSDLSCSTDNQCKIAAYGEQLCGGPNNFQVYSTVTTSQTKLNSLLNEFTDVNHHQNTSQSGMVTGCALYPNFVGTCVNGGCVSEIQVSDIQN